MFDKIKFKKTLIFVAVTFAIALFSLCSLISPLSSCGKHESDEGSAFSEGVFANSSSDVDIIISDTKFVNDTDGTMVTVSSGQHVVIDNCEFVGPLGVAVEVVGGEASVRNSTFSGFDGSAIIVGEADNVERCVLNVEGCSISNSKSSAICAINSDLIVSSTQFSGCNSVEGAAIYSQDSTILIGADAEITDCSAEKGGAFSFYDCEATLNGVAIERCNAENGGAIYLGEGVTLEVQNGNIASNSATNVGGGVFVGKSSTINVLGGNIALNTADVNGAGIYGAENSRIMLSGGYVVENSATRSGAGIFAAGAFEMTGGVVSKNITTSTKANKLSFGAGIHLASGTAATISGGQISENKSTYRGGGIFSLRELSIVGETIVYANTSEEDGAGIFSAGETTYIGTASCEFEGAISANVSQSNGGGVCANVGTVVHNSGIVGENTELNPLFVGNKASSGSGVGIYNGHYVLNGGQILKNVGTTSSAVGVAMSGASSFQMNSGLIEGNSTTNAGVMGSAVRVAGGTFTMNGGEIRNHQSLSGGAIYCSANFVMTGGVISGNTATQNGGAIFVTKATATVLISGGVLEGNVAGANGGAIYGDQSCVIDISNSSSTPASLSTNSAVLGGAVYVSNATLSMDDGVISSNSSSGGAGVYGDNGSVINVSGGVISLNSSSGDGAGIYGAEGSTINLSSNGRIYANVSAGNGAGICALGTFLMTGGSVVENKNTGTLALGGGIYLLSEAEKTISGGIVSKNESAYRGGGIYSTCSLSVVGDAVISGNTCKEDGAGVFVNGEITLNIGTDSALFEGVIAENRTSGLGGGIVGYNKANIIHNSGIIGSGKVGSSTYSGNLAGSGSAVGLWSGATYTMNGGTLCGNDGLSVNGSAIAISHDLSLITINSGTIEGNFSTTYSIDGGAIRIIAGSCVMNGGEIKGNVDNNRGAVYCSNGSFSMSGGTISGNVSINGGGIYVATNGVCEISGGVISGNTANNGGGIYFAENEQSEISGGVISGNTANNGGGIYFAENEQSEISGGVISGNTAGLGAGVYVSGSLLSMANVEIKENVANVGGGGIYSVSTNLVLSDISVCENKIKSLTANLATSGAGICIKRGVIEICGGLITGNRIHDDSLVNQQLSGAGLSAIEGVQMTFVETTISENIGNGYGGGVNVSGTYTNNEGNKVFPNLVSTNSCILNNCAMMGGGIYFNGESLTQGILRLSGGEVSGNIATQTGGGVEVSHATSHFEDNVLVSENRINENIGDNAHSSGRGAGLALNAGYSYVTSATITQNIVEYSSTLDSAWGGGIYLTGVTYLYIRGGEISNNVACPNKSDGSAFERSAGGNIYIRESSTVNISGGVVSGDGNTLQAQYGGGISSIGTLIISGGTIKNCVANKGGGIVSYGGFVTNEEDPLDMRKNVLRIFGNATMTGNKAIEGIGTSLIVGNNIEVSGDVSITGTVAMSALIEKIENDRTIFNEHFPMINWNVNQNKSVLTLQFVQATFNNEKIIYNVENRSDLFDQKCVLGCHGFATGQYERIVYSLKLPSRYKWIRTDHGYEIAGTQLKPIIDGAEQDAIYFKNCMHSDEMLVTEEQCAGWFADTWYEKFFDFNKLLSCSVGSVFSVYTASSSDLSNFVFEKNADETGYVVSASESLSAEEIVIPAVYDGLPVLEIADSGFASKLMYNMVIGSKIVKIGQESFKECRNLMMTNFPNTLVEIGDHAFRDCSVIVKVSIPDSLSVLGVAPFIGCCNVSSIQVDDNNLVFDDRGYAICGKQGTTNGGILYQGFEKTVIQDSITQIADFAFYGQSYINSVFVIPDNVAIIGASAFENCSSLLGVEIGEGVVQIGTSAFAGCTKLETIVFNAIDCAGFVGSDTVHNNNVFANAGSRSDGISVTIGSSVKNVPSGLFYPQEYSVGVSPNITSLEIENGVENIGMYAFANLTLLNSISVSASVKTIGYCSFYRCLGLENLNFASGAALETIGRSAFNYCYNLEEIVIPNSVKTIDYCAFYRCSKLKNLTIGTGVQTIGDYAFACDIPDAPSVLENLVVKTSNLTIAASMFGGCANLLTLDTNSNVADNGFASATQIQNLTISESVLTIGSEAFADSIKNLSVKTSALTISAEMFGGCSSLETLHTNSDVSSAGAIGAAFWGCSTLKTLVVGQPQAEGVVTGIDLRANSFRETGLTSITLHEGVESIQSYAFYNTNITSVRIPASVRNVLGAPFLQCSLLTTIEIDDNNELFTDYDNNLIYGSSNKVLVDTCMGTDFSKLPTDIVTFGSYCLFNKPITSLTIPHTTTEIGYSALAYCAVMENLTIGSGVSNIDSTAFSGCSNIRTLMVLSSTLEISANLFGGGARLQSLTTSSNVADNGFEGLSQITSLTFNNVSGLNKIGAYAFAGCTGISDLNIPNNFNASEGNESPIGDYAFENCTGIVKLTFCADTLNNTVFSGCTNIATLQIMTTANVGMKDNFAGGANIVTLTTYSNNTVFSYSSKLETVYFYGTSIAQNAFFACDSLKDVYIDDSVETINSGAFARCTNLLYLFIPKSVTTLTSVFTFGPFTGAGGWDSEINCYLIKIYFETASELDGFQDGWRKNELTDDVNIFWGIDRKTYNGLVNNNGFMYETVNGKKYIKSYLGGEKEIEIPEDVYGISNRAFDKSSLTSITIPSNVKYIDAYAFAESQYLETVTIQSACVIGAGAFENCPMLKNVDLGPSIAVENYCFNGVTLSELTIPNTLTSIDEDAFIGLTVEKLYVELETVPQTRLCLEVKVIILSDNVKTLSQNSFSGCSGLSYLFLPQTVTTINRGAFYGCDNLMNIFCDYNYVHYTPDGWADNWYYYGSGSTEYYWRSYNDAGITLFTPSNEGTHYGINGAIRMNYTVGQFEEFLTKYDIVSTSASGEQIGESVLVSPMGKDGFQKKFVYGVMAFMLLCSGAVVTIMLLKSKKKENVLDDYDE